MTVLRMLVPVPVRRAAVVLAGVQVVLTGLYALHERGVRGTRQFDMDGELNVPTWWSAALFILAGLAALALARLNRITGRAVAPWTLVGLGLLALSLEEVAAIHEDVGTALGGGSAEVSVWPLAYSPVVVAGIWLLLRALRELPRALAAVGVAGLVCFVAVLGVELSALVGESAASIAVEENLELLGAGAILVALASHLLTRFALVFARREPFRAAGGEGARAAADGRRRAPMS